MDDFADFSSDSINSAVGQAYGIAPSKSQSAPLHIEISGTSDSQPKSASMPAPMRNNNPGALMPGGKLAQYDSPEEGLTALDNNLKSYGNKGVNTLAGVISKWAPPNENNTNAYIAHAAQVTGLDPNAQIDLNNPYVRHQISAAIVQHENGTKAIYAGPNSSAPSAQPDQPQAAAPQAKTDDFADFSSGAIDSAVNSAYGKTAAAPTLADQIPGGYGDGNTQTTPDKPTTWWDRMKGGVEGAAAAATGMVGGVVGSAAGVGYGLTHDLGTAQGARNAENFGANITDKMTYQPRTQAGQEAAQGIGDISSNLMALGPMGEGLAVRPGEGVPISDITREAPARIEPTMTPRLKLNVDGSRTPVNSQGTPIQAAEVGPATGPQSIGAAASTYSQQARAAGVTPEVQAAIDRTEGTPSFNRTAAERHIEASSLPVPMDLSEGQATGDVQQISHEQNMRGKSPEYARRFNEQNGQLVGNINAIRDAAAPDVFGANHVENGQSLIDFYNAKDAGLNADISAKYQALKDANGGEFPLKGSDFVDSADAALKKDNVTRFLPSEVAGILGDLREGGPMTYNDFENYRTILAQQARKAARSGDGTAEHAISLVRNSLENIPMSDETAAIKPLADEARSAAKHRFDLLRQDPAYNAAVNGTVAPDDFINKFVIKGKAGDIGTMRDNLMDEPMAEQVIASGAINHLKARAGLNGDNGNFSQAGYNKALQAMGPKLNQLVPAEQAQHLQSLGNVARYAMEQPRGSFVNNSNTLVGAIAKGAKDLGSRVLDRSTYGVSGFAQDRLAERAATRSAAKALEPGAGLTRISQFPK